MKSKRFNFSIFNLFLLFKTFFTIDKTNPQLSKTGKHQ